MRDDAVLGHALPLDRGLGPVQVRRQQTLAGHLCMLVNDQRVTCGRAGTA